MLYFIYKKIIIRTLKKEFDSISKELWIVQMKYPYDLDLFFKYYHRRTNIKKRILELDSNYIF